MSDEEALSWSQRYFGHESSVPRFVPDRTGCGSFERYDKSSDFLGPATTLWRWMRVLPPDDKSAYIARDELNRVRVDRAAVRRPALIEKAVGLERGEALVAHFGAERPDAVEAGDRRLVEGRMVDAPSRAMRPIDPNAIAHLAAEQDIARHAQRFGLRVEQSIFDRTEPLADHTPAAGRVKQ
jgi:hypothetical protein